MPCKGFRDGALQNKTPCNPQKPRCSRQLLVLLLAGEHGLILYGILKKFTGRLYEELLLERGYTRGLKLQINPSYSTYPTPLMWCMGLWESGW